MELLIKQIQIHTVWNQKVCYANGNSITIIVIQVHACAIKCSTRKYQIFQNAITLLRHNLNPFMASLQCLGSDAIPSHFIHKSSHRKQVTTHSLPWPPVPAESQEKAWWFEVTMSSRCYWGHCNVQGKLCAVALHHTLGNLQTATTCDQSHTGQFIQQLAWQCLQRATKWKMCSESQHLHVDIMSAASCVVAL